MTLLRSSLGSKPQRGEDWVGGGLLGLTTDPFLDSGKALGRLVDIVPVGNVGKRFEQLFEAVVAPLAVAGAIWRARHRGARIASRRTFSICPTRMPSPTASFRLQLRVFPAQN